VASDLLVIVPSRGRPDNVRQVIEAWQATEAFGDAQLAVAFDADDPRRDEYARVIGAAGPGVASFEAFEWMPMVAKLSAAALDALTLRPGLFAVGFAGDDHLPRTVGWARRYLTELRDLGTGIVYGDDGLQGAQLPTQWAMTANIVRALGRMVPADVEHLYCDNAVKDLGVAAGCLRYLPDVLVEHMHPMAGKAPTDDGYRRVNSGEQYARDRAAYAAWRAFGLMRDVEMVLGLRRTATPA